MHELCLVFSLAGFLPHSACLECGIVAVGFPALFEVFFFLCFGGAHGMLFTLYSVNEYCDFAS